MAESFGDLGLRAELAAAAEAAGYERPTALQRAAIPVLRRGGNAVLHGSSGAGVVGAYGLALLDRLAASGPVRGDSEGTLAPAALILVPTPDATSRVAATLARYAQSLDLRVTALEPGWVPGPAAVLVASPVAALDAVRAAALKLDSLSVLVLDGASALLALSPAGVMETLSGSVPREAQRVVVTGEIDTAVERYVEAHVRRALNIPSRPAAEPQAAPAAGAADYVVVREPDKPAAVVGLLASVTAARPALVHCRTRERARRAAGDLALRGLPAVADAAAGDGDGRHVVSYDVPFDAESLAARHGGGGLIVVEPRELPHLQRIASEAGFELRVRAPAAAAAADEIAAFRQRLRAAAREEDLGAQLLVLDPLFEELSAAEVAAAASALVRRRAAEAPVAPAEAAPAPAGPPPRTWTRLFISTGSKDGIRPGDLVGAITGETGISGDRVGKVEIRDTFSIVEIASDAAARVIQALNGTTLKGRSLRVDYDRGPGAGARERGGAPGARRDRPPPAGRRPGR